MKEIKVTWSMENNTVIFFVPIKDWDNVSELTELFEMFCSDEYTIDEQDEQALIMRIRELNALAETES